MIDDDDPCTCGHLGYDHARADALYGEEAFPCDLCDCPDFTYET
jgi:hypothetical protein